MDDLKYLRDKLIESMIEDMEFISCQEMGEMVDMVKDIEEALYYHHCCEYKCKETQPVVTTSTPRASI